MAGTQVFPTPTGGGGGGTPASSVVSETAFGQSPAVGTSTDYARADHTHGTPATPATGAPAEAEYLTLSANGTLTQDKVFSPTSPLIPNIGVSGTTVAVPNPATPPAATGTTWTVGTGADFADLATALASASVINGARLLLLAQTFTVSASITVSKQVTIQGASRTGTILQTAGAGADPTNILNVTTSNVVIRDLTLKQRRTTNSGVENCVNLAGGAGTTGQYLENCTIETMEVGVFVNSDGWQINNCHLAYVGPNNSNRYLLLLHRSDGSGLVTNNTYDTSMNGVITGNTRFMYLSAGGAGTGIYGGTIRVGNNRPSNAFPLHQFFNCDTLNAGATALTLIVDNNVAAETSAFIVFFGSTPFLTRLASLSVFNNNLTNTHGVGGKGMVALDGSGPAVASGNTTYYVAGNILANTTFRAGYATGVAGVPSASDAALLGYATVAFNFPNQALTTATPATTYAVGLGTTGVNAGVYTNSTIRVGSDGRVIAAANGAASAPASAQYLALAADTTLTGERVFTPSARLAATDAGANSTYTLDLATSGVVAGSYTSADITVDTYGRVTSAANGSGSFSVVTTAASPYNMAAATTTVFANPGAAQTVQLPAANAVGVVPGRMYSVKRINNSANAVTVTSAGGTIDSIAAGTGYTLAGGTLSSISVVSDGTNWWII